MNENQVQEILGKIHSLDRRITAIENLKNDAGSNSLAKSSKTYSGLTGGVWLLIKEGFLNSPKTLDEIHQKMKENNYHYGKPALAKTLANYFFKRDKILTRFKQKQGKTYVYVVKK